MRSADVTQSDMFHLPDSESTDSGVVLFAQTAGVGGRNFGLALRPQHSGAPWFKIQKEAKQYDIVAFSSKYALYQNRYWRNDATKYSAQNLTATDRLISSFASAKVRQ